MQILRNILFKLRFILLSNSVYYINSSAALPPPLTKAEEAVIMQQIKDGDEKAREPLIVHNLRLVVYIAKKFENSNVNIEDLISIGTIGLIKAVDTFKAESGTRFATYGAKCIQNEILMHFRSQKKLNNEISINETIDMDKEGNPLTYIDIIAVEDTIAEDIERKIHTQRAIRCVDTVLTERERRIIVLRYGLGRERAMTQREVAEKLGISRSYVSRIEKGALEKIKKRIE